MSLKNTIIQTLNQILLLTAIHVFVNWFQLPERLGLDLIFYVLIRAHNN